MLLFSQKVFAKYMMKFEWLFRRIDTTLLYLSEQLPAGSSNLRPEGPLRL